MNIDDITWLPTCLQKIVISYCDLCHLNEYIQIIQNHEYQPSSAHSVRIQSFHDMVQMFGWTSLPRWRIQNNYTPIDFRTYGFAIMRNIFNDLFPPTLDWLLHHQHCGMLFKIVQDNQTFLLKACASILKCVSFLNGSVAVDLMMKSSIFIRTTTGTMGSIFWTFRSCVFL